MEFGGADHALTVPSLAHRLSCSRTWNRVAVALLLISAMAVIAVAALLASAIA